MDVKDLYLLQKWDNGDFFIYKWAVGISKKGYTPIKETQAKRLIELCSSKKGNSKYLEHKDDIALFHDAKATEKSSGVRWDEEEARRKAVDDFDAEENNSIIDDALGMKVEVEAPDINEAKNLSDSQEDIQAKELKHIRSLRFKTKLEEYMLKKYQVDIPTDKLDVMKAVANSVIGELAKKNRLYLIDGKIN
jgi:hypothetical protein